MLYERRKKHASAKTVRILLPNDFHFFPLCAGEAKGQQRVGGNALVGLMA